MILKKLSYSASPYRTFMIFDVAEMQSGGPLQLIWGGGGKVNLKFHHEI